MQLYILLFVLLIAGVLRSTVMLLSSHDRGQNDRHLHFVRG